MTEPAEPPAAAAAAAAEESKRSGKKKSIPSQLICEHVLSTPPRRIGHGVNTLVYHNTQPAWQCSFSRDGQYLAVCYGAPDPAIRIWKWKKQQPSSDQSSSSSSASAWILTATLAGIHERTIRSVEFAPILSPLTLASASFDGTVAIWELVNNDSSSKEGGWECTAQLEGHDNEVKCVRWNATASLLATCGRDKTVWIWECFLPGTIGGGGGGGDQLQQQGGGGDFECLAVLNGHEGDVKCIQFASSHGEWGDGDEILISCSYDNSIKIWAEDCGDWYCASTIAGVHSSTIWSLALSPSGARLVDASADGSLAIYKCYTNAEKNKLFPDEASNNDNGLWKCVGKLPDAHASPIYSVHYAPAGAGHGRIATCGADNRLRIFKESSASSSDKPMFQAEVSVTTNHGDLNCVCWHPTDGTILATVGDDGTAQIWKFVT
jgi:cytosolic iron-sulfur protein assembly protein CIAO1